MHHPKKADIDGVKFVLIPEELYEHLTKLAEEYFRYTGFGEGTLQMIRDYEEGK